MTANTNQMISITRAKSATVLVLTFLLLGGCSAFGLLYERLAWLSSWQFDRMFDLDDSQKLVVRSGARQMAEWLNTEGFPVLIEDLENARVQWDNGQHADTILLLEQMWDTNRPRFLQALSPALVPLLLTLGPENAAHFRAYNQRHFRDWYEYAGSDEAKLAFRSRQLTRWFGNLSEPQLKLVSDSVSLLPGEQAIRIENNRQWTEQMLNASLDRDRQALVQWLEEPSRWWTEEFQQLRAANRAQLLNVVNRLLVTLTPKQQQHFSRRLGKWIKTLNSVLPSNPEQFREKPGPSQHGNV